MSFWFVSGLMSVSHFAGPVAVRPARPVEHGTRLATAHLFASNATVQYCCPCGLQQVRCRFSRLSLHRLHISFLTTAALALSYLGMAFLWGVGRFVLLVSQFAFSELPDGTFRLMGGGGSAQVID